MPSEEKERTIEKKGPKYQIVNGYKLNPVFEGLSDSLKYQPRPDDLFIVTYPKCGTTWTQHIVTMILNDGKLPKIYYKEGIFAVSPFLELSGRQSVIEAQRPCAIKTHLPYELQPKHPLAKYIIVIRNPKDACVSFYYHQKMFLEYDIQDMDFHEFFPYWLSGDVECGDYFDFVLSWWNHRNDPNVLILFYEDMKSSPSESIMKIASFMGNKYATRLTDQDGGLLKQIVRDSSFEKTKDIINEITFKDEPDIRKGSKFARKGIVGDWKNHFSTQENKDLEAKFYEKFNGSGLENVWNNYDIFSQ